MAHGELTPMAVFTDDPAGGNPVASIAEGFEYERLYNHTQLGAALQEAGA